MPHVFAIGKGESSRNCMVGDGSSPDGGSEPRPVVNIRTSSTVTAAWGSVIERHGYTSKYMFTTPVKSTKIFLFTILTWLTRQYFHLLGPYLPWSQKSLGLEIVIYWPSLWHTQFLASICLDSPIYIQIINSIWQLTRKGLLDLWPQSMEWRAL